MLDDAGEPAFIRSVSLDITALKQAESERARSHSMLQATLDATTDAILVVDLEGHITEYNRPYVELWAIPRTVLRAGDDAAVLASVVDRLADPETFIRRVTEIYEDPEAISHDVFQLVDGRTIERDSAPQRLGGRRSSAASGASATSPRSWPPKRRCESSEQRYRETLENIALIAAGIDQHGIVTFANDAS